ncbi:centromere protein O [Gadus macrocephalus]|uniref:centromere protein O n=1 Tax=Gadus macrocephalus TaxID=80720 RepID=UPI0028CBA43B|nr:centromere protein O [Gadus macrocephalus]
MPPNLKTLPSCSGSRLAGSRSMVSTPSKPSNPTFHRNKSCSATHIPNGRAQRERILIRRGNMSTQGILCLLESQATRQQERPPQQSGLENLRATVNALVIQRDQLKAKIEPNKELGSDDPGRSTRGEGAEGSEGSVNSQLLQLMARHAQLTDRLHAHHLIGGYDIIETRQGKGVCVSVATSYEGVYLERYSLEMVVAPAVQIVRHDVPVFVPLARLAEKDGALQHHLTGFLGELGRLLDGYAGRRQQLRLLKEQQGSVSVMESNVPCSLLVLTLAAPRTPPLGDVAVLCKLHYSDHTRCLPQEVTVQSEDGELPETAQWKGICTLLKQTPLHKAVATLIQRGDIK